MDFTNRNTQSSANSAAPTSSSAGHNSVGRADKPSKSKTSIWLQISAVALLFSVTVLAIAVIAILAFGGRDQSKFLNSKKYQAVFLTNGQVYFGNIKEMGSDFYRLDNVYYLQTAASSSSDSSSSSTNNNYNLVQLGCQQIHDPYNEMIINRGQVSFWENLQDGGQVVQKINQFKKQYPTGPDCSQVSNQTQASSNSSSAQPSSSTTNNSSSSNSSSSSSSSNSTTKKP